MDVEAHERALKAINARILKGEKVDVKREIAVLLGENPAENELKDTLDAEINRLISPKLRQQLTVQQYFRRREMIRDQILNANEEAEKRAKEEENRITGKCCPSCGSENTKSYGASWRCVSCGREWRKRMAKKRTINGLEREKKRLFGFSETIAPFCFFH